MSVIFGFIALAFYFGILAMAFCAARKHDKVERYRRLTPSDKPKWPCRGQLE